jgi:hypothetical protein
MRLSWRALTRQTFRERNNEFIYLELRYAGVIGGWGGNGECKRNPAKFNKHFSVVHLVKQPPAANGRHAWPVDIEETPNVQDVVV